MVDTSFMVNGNSWSLSTTTNKYDITYTFDKLFLDLTDPLITQIKNDINGKVTLPAGDGNFPLGRGAITAWSNVANINFRTVIV